MKCPGDHDSLGQRASIQPTNAVNARMNGAHTQHVFTVAQR